MRRDTGLVSTDAESDFQRARRRQILSQLSARLRREPDDVRSMLPFEDLMAVLGRVSERRIGLEVIPVSSIVGSVEKAKEFDRAFRPTSNRIRHRWQRIDAAQRKGEPMPPIDVYRVGDLHFVRDGHHRVSVAVEMGLEVIDAYVTEVKTRLSPDGIVGRHDLITKDYERIFKARVPLPIEMATKIRVSDPWFYAEVAEAVEAWGFRLIQEKGAFCERAEVANRWFREEYEPVVKMLRDQHLIGERTETEAYLRVARERYRLLRAHEWSDEIVARLAKPLRRKTP
jgi:hypothetical protein